METILTPTMTFWFEKVSILDIVLGIQEKAFLNLQLTLCIGCSFCNLWNAAISHVG